MNLQKQKNHRFHLVIDNEMKKCLEDTKLYKKLGNLSQFIVRILVILSPDIEKKHITNKQMASQYALIHEDIKVIRKGVYIYLPKHRYRQLKAMHHDLDFYSMAQLVRMFLGVFLDFVKVYGDDVESKLMSLYRQWKSRREEQRHEWWPIEELLHFCFQKARISRFLTLYSWKFQPIGFFRM